MDARDAINKRIDDLTKELHLERFPEEYDYMYDSHADSLDRSRGINPMSEEYIAKTNEKRIKQGVLPLLGNGYAADDASMKLCEQEAIERIKGKA